MMLRAISPRCVFIIGPARSGTTVLLNALNASRDIFMLGEPDLHTDPGTPDFAARYGKMHAGWGNLACKSTALPHLLPHDGPWWHWLSRLAEYHRRTGAKIALNPGINGAAQDRLLAVHGAYFYDSTYIFCFRDPLAAAVSRQRLAALNNGAPASWDAVFENILSVIRLYVHMAALFPHVHAVLHEDIGAATFATLAQALDCDLSAAPSYYATDQVRAYSEADIPEAARQRCRDVRTVYGLLRDVLAEGPALAQREQNAGNIDPSHRTALGRLALVLDPAFAEQIRKVSK